MRDGSERRSHRVSMATMPSFAAVVFDMDGVLVHSGPVHYAAYREVFAREGVDLAPADYRRLFGRSREQVIMALLPELDEADIERLCLAKQGAVERVLTHQQVEPIPGALELAHAVGEAGLARAVTTSSRAPGPFLEAIGATELFPVVVDRTMVRRPKPDPEPYLLTAERLGVEPAHCLVLEDSPVGVRAARAAGATVLALTTSYAAEALGEAHAILRSFDDVWRWLR